MLDPSSWAINGSCKSKAKKKLLDSCGLSNKKLTSQWLVVNCLERKLTKHVKGVREENKER